MGEMRREIVRLNIERYERLLETETDEAKRRTLESLLAEARGQAMLIGDEGALEQPGREGADLLDEARRWRMRADEYRVIADACQSDGARSTYLQLARSYDALADRAQGMAASQSGHERAG